MFSYLLVIKNRHQKHLFYFTYFMKYTLCLYVFLTLVSPLAAGAQSSLPMPEILFLPIRKEHALTTATPEKNYWQNTANYHLNIQFNPETLWLQGVETVEYTNNSPDTLRQVLFKLYPNLYKKGALRMAEINSRDIGDGLTIDSN